MPKFISLENAKLKNNLERDALKKTVKYMKDISLTLAFITDDK